MSERGNAGGPGIPCESGALPSSDTGRVEKVRIVYIVGLGRSGSTLIDRLLASSPNAFSVGQLENFRFFVDEHDPRRTAQKTKYCDDQGCRLRESPFWEPVVEEMERDGRAIYDPCCPLYIGKLLRGILFRQDLPFMPRFDDGAFYRAILAQARLCKGPQVSILVDSSKDLKRLIGLRRDPSLDVFAIHLVRDVRGVVHSWEKRNRSGVRALRRWLALNTRISIYLRIAVPRDHYVRLSYDRFTRDPSEAVRRLNRACGLRVDPERFLDAVNSDPSWRFSGDGHRRLPVSTIRADEAWRTQRTRTKRWFMTVLACIPNYFWVHRRLTQ